jgi:hypothetical protein
MKQIALGLHLPFHLTTRNHLLCVCSKKIKLQQDFLSKLGVPILSLIKIEDEEKQDKKLMQDVIKITADQTSSHAASCFIKSSCNSQKLQYSKRSMIKSNVEI